MCVLYCFKIDTVLAVSDILVGYCVALFLTSVLPHICDALIRADEVAERHEQCCV